MPKCECGNYFSGAYCKICSEPPEKKARKNIRKVSKKRVEENKEYLVVRNQYLIQNPICEYEGCKAKATELHHKNARNGARLNDNNYFMSICSEHHLCVHANPKESFKKGYLILRSK